MAMSMGANSVDEVAAELGALMKAKPPTTFRQTLKLLGQALELRRRAASRGRVRRIFPVLSAQCPVLSRPRRTPHLH
jgi:3-polyprenyl-4-hydroxybenzoate decarboxylase